MRILQINATINSGSTGRIARDISHSLSENGHKSYIAFGRGQKSKKVEELKIGRTYDFILHYLNTRLFDRHGLGSKLATKSFIEKITKLDFDLIHLHNLHGYYINIEILFNYLKESNKPVVWTLHDCWAYTGHCAYYDLVNCQKWRTQCFRCPNKYAYPASILFDNSRKNYQKKKSYLTKLINYISLHLQDGWQSK